MKKNPALAFSLLLSVGIIIPVPLRAGTVTYPSSGTPVATPLTTTSGDPLTLSVALGSATQSGVISGDGGVTKSGSGQLTLTGANTFTGGTTIADGILSLGSPVALGTAGTISFTGGILQSTSSNSTDYSSRFSTAANQQYRIETTSSASLTLSSALTSAGGSLTKTGSGILTLSGANTYTGGTTLAGGILSLNSSSALGSSGTISFTGGTLRFSPNNTNDYSARFSTATSQQYNLDTSGQNITLGTALTSLGGFLTKFGSGTLTLTAANTYSGSNIVYDGTLQIGAGGTTGSIAGSVSLYSSSSMLVFNRSDNLTYAGTISVNGSFTKLGAGNLTLSGSNTYTGATTISAGTLTLGANDRLSDVTAVTIAAGATFNLAGFSDTIGGLAGAGNVNLGGGTLTSSTNSSTTLSGIVAGSGSLVKTGGGTLTLSGANTYTGSTSINGGTLVLANTTASSGFELTGGARLTFDVATSYDAGAMVFSGTGTLIKAGAGTLKWGPASATFALGTGSLIDVRAGTLQGGSNANDVWTNNHAGLNVAGDAIFDGDEANVRVAALTGTGTIKSGYPGAGYVNFTFGLDDASGAFGGVLTNSEGVGNYAKIGTGTQTLSGNNTYTGTTTLAGGILALGSAGALGTTGTIFLTGGTLQYSSANATDYSARFSTDAGQQYRLDTNGQDISLGAALTSSGGSLTKLGAGTLTLALANSYSGGSTLSGGTVVLGDDAALGTGGITLNGSTLAGSSGARTLANALVLSADTTLTGSQALTFTGALTLAANRDLTVTNTALTTFAGPIGETGLGRGLFKYGAGTLALTGANTYSGGTFLAEGTTIINNLSGSAFGTGAVTVASGATLTGAGSFTGAFQNNGTYAPGNSPTLAVLSSFYQGSAGTLVLELGGLTRGTQYDALDITGTITFGGTLQVALINGFTPAAGNSFDLLNYTTASGSFSQLTLPTLNSGLSWNTSALYTTGVLSVAGAAIPEPSTYAIFVGFAALSLAALRRRRGAA